MKPLSFRNQFLEQAAGLERVTHLLSHESPAVFVVMADGRYEILTKYDLMGTIAELMEQAR